MGNHHRNDGTWRARRQYAQPEAVAPIFAFLVSADILERDRQRLAGGMRDVLRRERKDEWQRIVRPRSISKLKVPVGSLSADELERRLVQWVAPFPEDMALAFLPGLPLRQKLLYRQCVPEPRFASTSF